MTCAVRTCAAAAVAALLVSAAAAAPIDTMDIQDVHIDKPRGQLAEIEADVVGILAPGDTGGDPASDINTAAREVHDVFYPLHQYGKIYLGKDLPWDADTVVAAGDVMGKDNRDSESSYVFETRHLNDGARFIFYNAYGQGQYLMRMVTNPMSDNGQGWFLGVHDARGQDTLDGRLRVILHSDASKAAIWEWTHHPYGNGKVLQLADNMDASGACKGCYLAGPPNQNAIRTDNSFYLLVTPDPGEAANVNVHDDYNFQEPRAALE